MSRSTDPEDDVSLTRAEFNILLALADGDRHGYGIMQEIQAQTAERLRLGPGTLYRTLKQLLERGWIEESDERPDPALDDERRRYYRLRADGRAVARAEAEKLEQALDTARRKKLLSRARVGGAVRGSRS